MTKVGLSGESENFTNRLKYRIQGWVGMACFGGGGGGGRGSPSYMICLRLF